VAERNRKEGRSDKRVEGLNSPLLTLKMKEGILVAKKCMQPLETEMQIITYSPTVSRKECSPDNILILVL